jgi:hypothetical protein
MEKGAAAPTPGMKFGLGEALTDEASSVWAGGVNRGAFERLLAGSPCRRAATPDLGDEYGRPQYITT